MVQINLTKVFGQFDAEYYRTAWFWVTTTLILGASALYLRIKLKRTRYLPWEESGL